MILDAREIKKLPFEQQVEARRRVFVDGVEDNLVWYVDTDEGFVRTLDVLGDGCPHSCLDLTMQNRMASDWDDVDGVASRTVFGTIELKHA
jgi:hypothetical protein